MNGIRKGGFFVAQTFGNATISDPGYDPWKNWKPQTVTAFDPNKSQAAGTQPAIQGPPGGGGTIGPNLSGVYAGSSSISGPSVKGTIGPNISYGSQQGTMGTTSIQTAPAANYTRWNEGAAAGDRLNHFGDSNNLGDTHQELLSVKGIYDTEMKAGASNDRLNAIHDWANQIRDRAGIDPNDPIYGNAPDVQKEGFANIPTKPPIGAAPPAQGQDYSAIMDIVSKKAAADLQDKITAINQQLEKAIQSSQLSVNQNNQQLQEQIKGLQDQKAQYDQDATQLQNRRGGFYSGGLDYQLGNIAKGSETTQGNAQRDVAARNADIWSRNSLLAQQAAESIKQLQTGEPDHVRQLIMDAVNNERSNQRADASLTGTFNGTPTLASQQFGLQNKESNWNAYKDSVGMTGNLGNGPQSDWGNLGGTNGAPSYQSVQDAIKNGMTQQQIDNTAKQFVATMGYNYDNMNANDKQAWAQIAISQQNANTSSLNSKSGNTNQNISHLMDVWKNTGTAPAGLESLGVKAGTSAQLKDTDIADLINKSPLVKKQMNDAGQVVGTTVDSADKSALMLYIKSLPGMTAEKAQPFFYQFGLYSGN
jgi:hypothetical protein